MSHIFHQLTVATSASTIWLVGHVIDSASAISIGQAGAVGAGIWYLSSRLQRQDDQLDAIRERIDNLPCSRECAFEQTEPKKKKDK